jgi:hypothetical protein
LISCRDDLAGFLSDQVRRVTFFFERRPVAIPVELVHPFMGEVVEHPEEVAVLVVEAAGVGLVGFLEFTEVPLPRERGAIAGRAQGIGQRTFGERQTPAGPRRDDRVDARLRRVTPGQQRGASRRADRLDVVVLDDRAALGETVDIRRLDILAAVEATIGVAQVIDQEEDDVRLRGRLGAQDETKPRNEQGVTHGVTIV